MAKESGVRRWVVDVARWDPAAGELDALAAALPPYERPAIARFVKVDDRKRALVSRLLQYSLVHDVLGIPFDKINIQRTVEGKPYLKTENELFPNFNFNASHQGDYVGVASEPLRLVGLDIACISKPQEETTLDFISHFSSYLTDHEWNNIVHAGTSDEILKEFYRYWCLKEAFVKAIGAGVGFGLHRLEFHHVNWNDISVHIDAEESGDWRFWLFKLDETHLAAIAKGHPMEAVDSYRITLSKVDVEEEEHRASLHLPEHPFISRTVEQLLPAKRCSLHKSVGPTGSE